MKTEDYIKANTGLVYKIMNDSFYGIEREDLFQSGMVGLLKAIKNYKIESNVKFSTYAFKFIFGEMYALAIQKQIKVSKDYLKLYRSIEKTRYALAQKLNYIPSDEEVALFLEKDVSLIKEAILAGSIIVSSLDKGTNDDRSIYETIPSNESISLEDSLILKDSLSKLSNEERKIVYFRYFKDMTQSEVARKLNKKQVTISRYEKKSLDKIKEYYAA